MPSPAARFAHPRPWAVAPDADPGGDFVVIRTTSEPVIDVAAVVVDGNTMTQVEATASLIAYWSEQDAVGLIP